MKHYHGTPMGGPRVDVPRILKGRFALIPFNRPEDLAIAFEVCCGVAFDNGAFSAWKSGAPITDWRPYYALCYEWANHPRFEFAIIPDVIDGTEGDNDDLIQKWQEHYGMIRRRSQEYRRVCGVPVWHLHESLERLRRLAVSWPMVALGSSGVFSEPGSASWEGRMSEAMKAVCDDQGRPICRLHGLRMLAPDIVARFPFYSADSSNVAQNKNRPWSTYEAPTASQKADVIAARIEAVQSPAEWTPDPQKSLFEPV